MTGVVHILRTPGHYVGQVRLRGHRTWQTVTGRCGSSERALGKAVTKMTQSHKRARSVFVPTGDSGAYYDPHVSMEACRA